MEISNYFVENAFQGSNEKKTLEYFPTNSKIIEKNLSLWGQTNGPNFEGACEACMQNLQYINYIMAHHIARDYMGGNDIENLRVSCLSCNTGMGVMPFDDYIEKYYPNTKLQKLLTQDAKQAAMIMRSSKMCVALPLVILQFSQ